MSKNIPLTVAGIIFSIVALIHAIRIIGHWQISISGHAISMSTSIIALIVSVILALWMFLAVAKK